jgi:hypothetical protein
MVQVNNYEAFTYTNTFSMSLESTADPETGFLQGTAMVNEQTACSGDCEGWTGRRIALISGELGWPKERVDDNGPPLCAFVLGR